MPSQPDPTGSIRRYAAEVRVAHCRFPAWERGDFVSRSAPASIGVSFTGQACAIASHGSIYDLAVEADAMLLFGEAPPTWLRVDAPSELIEVSASETWRRKLADELACPDHDLGDLTDAADLVVWGLAAQLRALLAKGKPEALEIETLVQRLYAHVYQVRFGGRPREKGNGGLDARRLSRLRDYVVAHATEPMTLAQLAEAAALSPFHFHRSFRRSTGMTPHRFVLLWRARCLRDMMNAGGDEQEVRRRFGLSNRRAIVRLLNASECG